MVFLAETTRKVILAELKLFETSGQQRSKEGFALPRHLRAQPQNHDKTTNIVFLNSVDNNFSIFIKKIPKNFLENK